MPVQLDGKTLHLYFGCPLKCIISFHYKCRQQPRAAVTVTLSPVVFSGHITVVIDILKRCFYYHYLKTMKVSTRWC